MGFFVYLTDIRSVNESAINALCVCIHVKYSRNRFKRLSSSSKQHSNAGSSGGNGILKHIEGNNLYLSQVETTCARSLENYT